MPVPSRASITAVHGYVPPDVLTNADLAHMVDTTDAWITERTGIKERHILKGEGLGTSHMGAQAVRGLLEKTGTHRTLQPGESAEAELRAVFYESPNGISGIDPDGRVTTTE